MKTTLETSVVSVERVTNLYMSLSDSKISLLKGQIFSCLSDTKLIDVLVTYMVIDVEYFR